MPPCRHFPFSSCQHPPAGSLLLIAGRVSHGACGLHSQEADVLFRVVPGVHEIKDTEALAGAQVDDLAWVDRHGVAGLASIAAVLEVEQRNYVRSLSACSTRARSSLGLNGFASTGSFGIGAP
jgi:hypothetical protein